jgi:hypothetical protein
MDTTARIHEVKMNIQNMNRTWTGGCACHFKLLQD